MTKIFFKTLTFFGIIFIFSNNLLLADAFKKYRTDAQMQCWGDNGQVLFVAKGDTLMMQSPNDVMSFKLGRNLKKNGKRLEFIAQAGFMEIYVNFETRNASMMGLSFQCN